MKTRAKSKATAGLVAILITFVPSLVSAKVIDLTGSNDSGRVNNAQFDWTPSQPTGTGFIQSFLRVQASPTEQGYNTSGGTPFDDKAGPFTHDITVADLNETIEVIDGVSYFKLLLDVNEPGGGQSLISLDRLEFYTSPEGGKTTEDVGSLGILRWSLDTGGNNSVLLDAARNHGSGSGDMFAYIPVKRFRNALPTDFVYMYVEFGTSAGASSEGGFEEWSLDTDPD
jgi:hypothetical protein